MTTERELPFSRDSEQAALGALLLSPRLLIELADFRTDDLMIPAHREILDAMRAVDALDVITLADELGRRGVMAKVGGESYLLELSGKGDPVMFPHHVAIVREKAVARRLIHACTETAARAYGGATMEDLLPEHRRQIAAIDIADSNDGPVKIGDAIDGALEHVEKKAANPDAYQITTGLADFDHSIGGMRAGHLVIVAAQPGQGKTSFAEGVALYNGARKVPVLIFSLEMMRQELIERALSSESGINGRKIVSGRVDYNDWKTGLLPAAEKLRPMPIWIDERRTLTADRICSEARRWREKHTRGRVVSGTENADNRALVVIDYLGLVRSPDRTQNREREVASMTLAFKGLAGELGCPVMLISQLSRGSAKENRKPVPSDCRDSGAIEADADMIIFPWREAPTEDQMREQPEVVDATIIVAKHRNGPIGELPVKWKASTTQFLDNDYERFNGGANGHQQAHFTETNADR